MNGSLERAVTLLQAIGRELSEERITFMAGSLAYNAFVSLLPVVVLLLVLVSEVGDRRLVMALLGLMDAAITPGAGEVLIQEVRAASSEVSVLGGVLLVWGGLRVFRSLDTAFSELYDTTERNTFLDQIVDGLVVLASTVAVLLAAGALQTRLTVDVGFTVGWFGQRLLLVGGVGSALLPMYYLFPDETEMDLLEVLPGVAVSAAGLVLFQSLFLLYLQFSSTAARESILASILVFLTWLYFSGLIILVGAAVNAVLSNRSENVTVRPLIGDLSPVDEPGDSPVDPDTVAVIDDLATELPTARDVRVVVDGESVALPPPRRSSATVDQSRLPLANDTVELDIVWESD